MADLDPNVWYHLTERRVNFNSSLQAVNAHPVKVWPYHKDRHEHWQFLRLDDGKFQIRYRATTLNKQLSTCWFPRDKQNLPSQPCLSEANGSDEQKWMIEKWDGGNDYKIQNVLNGSRFNVDVHVGNPVYFEEAATGQGTDRPGQHWQFKSVANIDDRVYQTPITNMPVATGHTTSFPASATDSIAQPGPESSLDLSQHSGLSTGKIIGIAAGCVAAVVLAGLAVLYARRRVKLAKAQVRSDSLGRPSNSRVVELGDYERHELGNCSLVETEGRHPRYQGHHSAQQEPVEIDSKIDRRRNGLSI
ncbi:hypothetical protein EJ05DRAFT_26135 [Pseudovirgaria hyperparasitica]|uniref:Ricin B lectin domain-containing protein n=1 Tax=Pseudovirgaria hyperparasitica TaxID=470096 RepID=A0A6A6WLM6_9PEZI|nr:uncharacterized protein EJ05DRAFT_26135 [Pseudovirgaria hyperparasitica]KAF2763114.1 hypothetical protein EJ05DRAFT_26135 [Pseudovirgaria hyperparasitica]